MYRPVGSHAAWDAVLRGIPCRVGYHAARDTVPRGIPRRRGIPCRVGYHPAPWDYQVDLDVDASKGWGPETMTFTGLNKVTAVVPGDFEVPSSAARNMGTATTQPPNGHFCNRQRTTCNQQTASNGRSGAENVATRSCQRAACDRRRATRDWRATCLATSSASGTQHAAHDAHHTGGLAASGAGAEVLKRQQPGRE